MSNRIKELREKQARIVAEARERNDLINDNTDEARVRELETAHDAAMAEHDRIEKLIEREEQLASLEKRMEERDREQRDQRHGNSRRVVYDARRRTIRGGRIECRTTRSERDRDMFPRQDRV